MLREWNLYLRRSLNKVALSVFLVVTLIGATPRGKETVLKGRIVAQAENNAEDLGSGSFLGSSQHFVFEVQTANSQREFVKIFYVFKNSRDRLPLSYLDYSVLHSFTAIRDSLCDDSLENMAYTQGFDEKGHPIEHQFTLKMAKGAPKLEITKDKLPCYRLMPQGINERQSTHHNSESYK